MTKEIKLSKKIKATPEEIFTAITNPLTIELWTGMPAKVELEPGGNFSMLDGEISGKIVDFEHNQKLVQLWSFGEENEPSLVSIELKKDKNNTIITVHQNNIPKEAYENMVEGWKGVIFKGLADFF